MKLFLDMRIRRAVDFSRKILYNSLVKKYNGVFIIDNIKVFISHSSQDKDMANEICAYLERHAKSCWIAPRNIAAGAEYGEEIINGIENSDVMVLVFSKSSNESQHVLREIERAVNRKMPIIAFKTENCALSKSMEYFLLANQWLDATGDTNAALLPLNESVDRVYKLKSKLPNGVAAPVGTVRVANKAIPFMLGVVAVTIIAAAIVIVSVYGNSSDSKSDITEPAPTTVTAETPAITTAVTEAVTTEVTTAVPKTLPEFNAGEFIRFGNYRPTGYTEENDDSSIKWQILEVGDGTLRLISAQIIDIKPFDCAESGEYDKDSDGKAYDSAKLGSYTDEQLRQFRGSNEWESSDLRAWLNSKAAPRYYGMSQGDKATDEHGNGYIGQLGFLSGFSDGELERLCKTDETFDDTVTLLTLDEIDAYQKISGFILHPTATKSAIASDTTSWYRTYADSGARDYIWVTKSPETFNACEIYVVDSELAHELYVPHSAAASGLGVRPVITVKYSDDDAALFDGEGTSAAPYIFDVGE